MLVKEIMQESVRSISPQENVRTAARYMREGDFGVLPVVENDIVIGMITDRDVVVRVVAEDLEAESTPVREAMTSSVLKVSPDDDIREASRMMSENQVRRLAVVNSDSHLVGVISLGDLAEHQDLRDSSADVLEDVSQPYHNEPQPPESGDINDKIASQPQSESRQSND